MRFLSTGAAGWRLAQLPHGAGAARQGRSPFWGPWGEAIPVLFQHLEAAHMPWLSSPSSIFHASVHLGLLPSLRVPLTLLSYFPLLRSRVL